MRASFGCAMMVGTGSMDIEVLVDEGVEGPDATWLKGVVERVLVVENAGPDVEADLLITTQERVQQLNKSYRNKDEPTDVLAFCMAPAEEKKEAGSSAFISPPDGVLHLGEIIISYPQAVIQAREHRHSVEKEIAILVIHGVLHLLGYDHEETEMESQMRAREKEILRSIVGAE